MKFLCQRLLFTLMASLSLVISLQAQFFLNGSAIAINDSCYQLTSANNTQVGSIWNGSLVSLEESFELIVDVFVGCADETGADGMVFGLQPVSTSIGVSGGDIGFGGVVPSLGVEIDTYQNLDYADPAADHIAIVQDGNLNHNSAANTLAGPVQASAVNANIEDCNYHSFRISWDAMNNTLRVYFDCDLRLSYEEDIVNTVFGGDPLVYWGFTSATGGLNNVHEICFSYTSFIDELADQVTCPGEEIQLEVSGGISYSWSPASGLSATDIPNPIASPTETTLYTVEILDDCGVPFYDDVLITVDNDQFDVSILTDPVGLETAFAGETFNLSPMITPDVEADYTYLWSSAFGTTLATPDSQFTTATASSTFMGTESITLMVVSPQGCIQDTVINIEITAPLFEMPNVFSPNGDAVNDRFGLFTLAQIDSYSCKVFNRWGQLMFETDSIQQFWDGTYKETAAPADVYIYQANFEIGDMRYEKQGNLTLIR